MRGRKATGPWPTDSRVAERLNVFKASWRLCPDHGDLSGNAVVGLEDAILALQVAAGQATAAHAICPAALADTHGNGRSDPVEAVYVLQKEGGSRGGEQAKVKSSKPTAWSERKRKINE